MASSRNPWVWAKKRKKERSINSISRLQPAFEIPFYGMHVSMFTLLWAATTVLYTWYNMKHMDMTGGMGGQNMQMMKYMQYGMPVMFLFFFNTFAAGLTCYLFFSNLTTHFLIQTLYGFFLFKLLLYYH